ncbi:MAG TPA: hypothetical protein VHJ54_11855 [Solirubrobacterales bacterium]|nr:hypothetical protein [Solirubrobacterales bacterium]
MPAGGRLSLLAIAVATLLAGCGGDDGGTIPADRADQLTARLTEVEGAVAEGDCDGARASANLFVTQVDQLPAEVDDEVKQALREGGERLQQLATEQCEEPDVGATGESGFQSEEPTTTPGTTTPTETTPETTTNTTTDEDTQPPDDGQGGDGGEGNQDGGNAGGGTGGVGGGDKG